MTDTITQQTIEKPSNVAKLVHVFSSRGEQLFFEDNYIHYVHPEAMEGLTGLTVRGLRKAQIHFLGKMQGNQIYEANWRNDSGVINFVDCEDLRVTNLTVINTRVFSPGNRTTEGSCAVNVANSRMRFERCRFDSMGKNCLSIHSDSYVELDDVQLSGYFFELFVGASEVVASRLQVSQDHVATDSRSAIWVSSSHHRGLIGNDLCRELCRETKVSIADSVFNMSSGNSLVSGAGSYDTRSVIDFKRITFTPVRSECFGVCAFSSGNHSITITTDFDDILDFISTPTPGFAKYISCEDPDAWPGKGYPRRRPAQPDSEQTADAAPILVDGLNSDNVHLYNHTPEG